MANVTIVDVAARAGVSVKTVSRVINKSPAVSEKTRNKIFQAMQDTGYQVNILARGLKVNRTNIIVVFADRRREDQLAAWLTVMLKYLFQFARKNGLKVVFSPSSSEHFETDETDGFYLIASGLADGAILLENVDNDSRIAYFEEHKLPYVVFGEAEGDMYPSVSMDNFDAGYTGARYLLNKGYRNITLLISERRFRATQLRIEGFEAALRNKECRYRICSEINTIEKAYRSANEILDQNSEKTAFFVSGDERALGVYRAIYEHGLKIPQDIAVLGIDNVPNGEYYFPPISTIGQNFSEMAEKCIDVLEEQITSGFDEVEHRKISYPGTVIERQST